jgi:hypothetical protein
MKHFGLDSFHLMCAEVRMHFSAPGGHPEAGNSAWSFLLTPAESAQESGLQGPLDWFI